MYKVSTLWTLFKSWNSVYKKSTLWTLVKSKMGNEEKHENTKLFIFIDIIKKTISYMKDYLKFFFLYFFINPLNDQNICWNIIDTSVNLSISKVISIIEPNWRFNFRFSSTSENLHSLNLNRLFIHLLLDSTRWYNAKTFSRIKIGFSHLQLVFKVFFSHTLKDGS